MSKITIPSRYRYTDWGKVIDNSGHFFDRATMRFFHSRISWGSLTRLNDAYLMFITSEQSPYGPRRYSVRLWNGLSISEIGEYQAYETLAQAKQALKKWVQNEASR